MGQSGVRISPGGLGGTGAAVGAGAGAAVEPASGRTKNSTKLQAA